MSVFYAGGLCGKMEGPAELRAWVAEESDPWERLDLERRLENAEALARWHSEKVADNGCFFCGGPLEYPVLFWSGAGGELLLHEGCCQKLLLGLGRDLDEVIAQRRRGALGPRGERLGRSLNNDA